MSPTLLGFITVVIAVATVAISVWRMRASSDSEQQSIASLMR
ncbi:MAG TPA: hypothetical protein PLF26_01105 [Blastocatellia bacterium]|nr:hypothetical protein [Blastocatellia bacterium]